MASKTPPQEQVLEWILHTFCCIFLLSGPYFDQIASKFLNVFDASQACLQRGTTTYYFAFGLCRICKSRVLFLSFHFLWASLWEKGGVRFGIISLRIRAQFFLKRMFRKSHRDNHPGEPETLQQVRTKYFYVKVSSNFTILGSAVLLLRTFLVECRNALHIFWLRFV